MQVQTENLQTQLRQTDFFVEFDKYNQSIENALSFLPPFEGTFIGRERELGLVQNILEQHSYNNVLMLAGQGMGKSALVREFVRGINDSYITSTLNRRYLVISVDLNKLSGVGRDRVQAIMGGLVDNLLRLQDLAREGLKDRLGDSSLRFIIFFDEVQTLRTVVAGDDKAGMDTLKNPLMDNRLLTVSATTADEYFKTLGLDKAFVERFEIVMFDTFDKESVSKIIFSEWETIVKSDERLDYWADKPYELNRGLREYMQKIASRIAPNSHEPRRTIKILSGYESYLRGADKLPNIATFNEFINVRYRIDPAEKLDVLKIINRLNERIIGQPMVKRKLEGIMYDIEVNGEYRGGARAKILLVGATGTGKTETARVFEEVTERALLIVDIPYYSKMPNGTGASQLLYDIGTFIEQHPKCIIVLDEFEKGIPTETRLVQSDCQDVLLRIFDKESTLSYRVQDAQNRNLVKTVSTFDTIFFLTSNAGYEVAEINAKHEDENTRSNLVSQRSSYDNKLDEIKKYLINIEKVKPEFLGRLDGYLMYEKFTRTETIQVANFQIQKYFEEVMKHHRLKLEGNTIQRYNQDLDKNNYEQINGILDKDLIFDDNGKPYVEFPELALLVGYTFSDEKREGSLGARGIANTVREHICQPVAKFIYHNPNCRKATISIKNKGLVNGVTVKDKEELEVEIYAS